MSSEPWLVIIDPQHVFASPDVSEWGSPFFADAMGVIQRIAPQFSDRVVVTRWVPTDKRSAAWQAYYDMWPFADREPGDPLFELVDEAAGLSSHPVLDFPTFGKWSDELRAATHDTDQLVLAGVSTDCCVLSTALPAADAGKFVTIVSDACAGSSVENNQAALHVMGLYEPLVTVTDSTTLRLG